ncbi:DsbA family oxidoreductase [Pontibacter vulgaris]|uniref:DsbA family oxidoreductase n=1 Tax=Pontibacter vulgaris TaxID=2905679 RepID=UPI001FA7953B|nr:DsbA family oxidoreductase [Pontibacter vulgaris]
MSKKKIKIDVVSDINCPWCYIGEQRLKSAMAAAGSNYDFEVYFKPFELNPNIPQEGQSKEEYFTNSYGPAILSQLGDMNKRMTETGRAEGIEFNFDKATSLSNTFNGHRLIWLADQYGVQEKVVNALFVSNFTEGDNVNDIALLKETGIANGIPAEKLEGFFESEEGKKEVREMEAWAQQAGIKGVPAFIFNEKYLVSGAQPAATFLEVFPQAAPAFEEIKAEGGSCDINGNC